MISAHSTKRKYKREYHFHIQSETVTIIYNVIFQPKGLCALFLILEINSNSPNFISPLVSALEPSLCWDRCACVAFIHVAKSKARKEKRQPQTEMNSLICLQCHLWGVSKAIIYKQTCHIFFLLAKFKQNITSVRTPCFHFKQFLWPFSEFKRKV